MKYWHKLVVAGIAIWLFMTGLILTVPVAASGQTLPVPLPTVTVTIPGPVRTIIERVPVQVQVPGPVVTVEKQVPGPTVTVTETKIIPGPAATETKTIIPAPVDPSQAPIGQVPLPRATVTPTPALAPSPQVQTRNIAGPERVIRVSVPKAIAISSAILAAGALIGLISVYIAYYSGRTDEERTQIQMLDQFRNDILKR